MLTEKVFIGKIHFLLNWKQPYCLFLEPSNKIKTLQFKIAKIINLRIFQNTLGEKRKLFLPLLSLTKKNIFNWTQLLRLRWYIL
jgi:hypothetical protein